MSTDGLWSGHSHAVVATRMVAESGPGTVIGPLYERDAPLYERDAPWQPDPAVASDSLSRHQDNRAATPCRLNATHPTGSSGCRPGSDLSQQLPSLLRTSVCPGQRQSRCATLGSGRSDDRATETSV
jgi:hypothetical protein